MLVSIITVCRNSESTIERTLVSVNSQNYCNIEHIIIDGKSSDNTINIIKKVGSRVKKIVSESDKGIYDAMNKGLEFSSGEIIGYLNSDDWYKDTNVLHDIANIFALGEYDYVYGDIQMVNGSGKLVRDWKTGDIHEGGLIGLQIPHPAFFVRADILKGLPQAFDITYKVAADLKQQLLLINTLNLKGFYIKRPIVVMSLGGTSTKNVFSYMQGWLESRRAYNEIFGRGGLYFTFKKVRSKFKGLQCSVYQIFNKKL